MSSTHASRKMEHAVWVGNELQMCDDGREAVFSSEITARHFVRDSERLTLDEDRAAGFAVGFRDEDMQPVYIRGRWSA